jgi:glycosyltransferase involved in cell wall biosynthesis
MPTLVYQFGDFGAALRALRSGEEETYYDQYRSVRHVLGLAETHPITVASVTSGSPYDFVDNDVRCIGLRRDEFVSASGASEVLDRAGARRVVLRTPHVGMLSVTAARGLPVLCCLADIFRPVPLGDLTTRSGLGRLLANRRLSRLLKSPNITCVANHSLSASRSLRDVLGVSPDRIVPWEWTRLAAVDNERSFNQGGEICIVYAGALSEAKGVMDLVRALQILVREGVTFRASLYGDGPLRSQLDDIAASVPRMRIMGRAPNSAVRSAMATADIVVVPSRHEYPEGLPNVIYEALASRAPLVVSDHPSFSGRLKGSSAVVQFPAANTVALSKVLSDLAGNPLLRSKMSMAAPKALVGLYVGVSWYKLISAFMSDPVDASNWVSGYSLRKLEIEEASGFGVTENA